VWIDGSRLVAPLTRQIGIVPGAATTLNEPLLVSTQIATLDHVTGGPEDWTTRGHLRRGHKNLVYDAALERAQKPRDSL
jgi:hypothetical protein